MPRELTDKERRKICSEAKTWLGVLYKLGGNSRKAIDCSHLVSRVFKKAGIRIAAKADWLFLASTILPKDQLRIGDLVFYRESPRPKSRIATHVGIFIGDGMVIHSSRIAGKVVIQKIEDIKGDLLEHKSYEAILQWAKELPGIEL
jgi:cell wall-associated NlpC family hydrolase